MGEGKKQKNGNPSHLLSFRKCLVKKNMKKSYPFISFKNTLQEISVFIGNLHSRKTNRGEKAFFSYSYYKMSLFPDLPSASPVLWLSVAVFQ